MKKKLTIIAAVFLFAGLGFGATFALNNRSSSKSLTDTYQQRIDETGAIIVDLTSQGASPDSVNIEVGKTVEFRARDGKSHNLSLGEGSGKRSSATGNIRLAHNGVDHNANKTDAQSTEGTHSNHHHEPTDFISGEFKADEAWRVTIKEAGTYFFHDHMNPDLNILVVAYQPKSN